MIISIKKFFFIFIIYKFKSNRSLFFSELNFRKIDFSNYHLIKLFIFKDNFYSLKNKNIHSFDFLNFSNKLGGKIGINLSKESIFGWFKYNGKKINFPWSEDLTSKRFINLLYNYEYINSSSKLNERKKLDSIIFYHLQRILFEFKIKKINEITSYDIKAYLLASLINNKIKKVNLNYIKFIVESHIDKLGMHKSYNLLEHSKYINNLNEIKNILLYFNSNQSNVFDQIILKMTSMLNQYFHSDGTLPLFNGSNNIYTKKIYNTLNKDTYLIKREFSNINNGIAYYGASESFGKNPEYLRYSAAHSTIVLQNTNISEIKEGNPHIKFPQSVVFRKEANNNVEIFEGSHNGYIRKFNKIIKRKIIIKKNKNEIAGEDTFISNKDLKNRMIYHIRFHLAEDISYNFTNSKKNIILKTKLNNIWLFKSDIELLVENSILVDNNLTKPIKQIVIKGVVDNNKMVRKWWLEKI